MAPVLPWFDFRFRSSSVVGICLLLCCLHLHITSATTDKDFRWATPPPPDITTFEGCTATIPWRYNTSLGRPLAVVISRSSPGPSLPATSLISKTTDLPPVVRDTNKYELVDNCGIRIRDLSAEDAGNYDVRVIFHDERSNVILFDKVHLTVQAFRNAGYYSDPEFICMSDDCSVEQKYKDSYTAMGPPPLQVAVDVNLHANQTCDALGTEIRVTDIRHNITRVTTCNHTSCRREITCYDEEYFNVEVFVTHVRLGAVTRGTVFLGMAAGVKAVSGNLGQSSGFQEDYTVGIVLFVIILLGIISAIVLLLVIPHTRRWFQRKTSGSDYSEPGHNYTEPMITPVNHSAPTPRAALPTPDTPPVLNNHHPLTPGEDQPDTYPERGPWGAADLGPRLNRSPSFPPDRPSPSSPSSPGDIVSPPGGKFIYRTPPQVAPHPPRRSKSQPGGVRPRSREGPPTQSFNHTLPRKAKSRRPRSGLPDSPPPGHEPLQLQPPPKPRRSPHVYDTSPPVHQTSPPSRRGASPKLSPRRSPRMSPAVRRTASPRLSPSPRLLHPVREEAPQQLPPDRQYPVQHQPTQPTLPVRQPEQPVRQPEQPVRQPEQLVRQPAQPVQQPEPPVRQPSNQGQKTPEQNGPDRQSSHPVSRQPKHQEPLQHNSNPGKHPQNIQQPVRQPPNQIPHQPVQQPTHPDRQPKQPGRQPTQSGRQPTQPGRQPSQPVRQPSQPGRQPTQSGRQPSQPVRQAPSPPVRQDPPNYERGISTPPQNNNSHSKPPLQRAPRVDECEAYKPTIWHNASVTFMDESFSSIR